MAIVAWVGERLAGYLTVLGPARSSETARLVAGQFHDVILAGDVAYRFPRDEESRRKLPAVVALLAVLGEAGLLWTMSGGVPKLAGVVVWDEARIGGQASDLASVAVTTGWPIAERIDTHRRGATWPMLADAKIIAATFALQQALPAALNGDQASLDDGLRDYR